MHLHKSEKVCYNGHNTKRVPLKIRINMTDYTSLYNEIDARTTRLNDMGKRLDELSRLIDNMREVA